MANMVLEQTAPELAGVSAGDTTLDFSDIGKIKVVLNNLALELPGQTSVSVVIPEMDLPLDLGALLRGEVKFSSLSLREPAIVLKMGPNEADVPPFHAMMEAAETVTAAIDRNLVERGLETVEIVDAHIDIMSGAPRSVSGIDLIAWRTDSGRLELSARLKGKRGDWRFQYFRENAQGDELGRQVFLANDVTLSDLLPESQSYRIGKGMALPIAVRLESRFLADGRFESANLVGRMLNGWFRQGRTLVRFDDAAVSLAWRGEDPKVHITRSHVIRGNTQIFYSGEITPPENPEDDWNWTVSTDWAQLGSADVPEPPISLDIFNASGRFVTDDQTLFFDKMEMRVGTAIAQAAGSLQITNQGPYLALAVEGEKFPVGLAKLIWPITLVPPARKWVIENMVTGMLDSFAYQGAIQPPAFDINDPDPGWSGDDVGFEMSFHDLEISPLGEVPHIAGLRGDLRVADEVMKIAAEDGHFVLDGNEKVDVPQGTFTIENLTERDGKVAVLSALVEGPVREIGEIFDSAPLKIAEKADLAISALSGTGQVSVNARFPLVKKLTLEEVDWSAVLKAQDFTTSEPMQGHLLENADIVVEADARSVSVKGQGKLDGLQADIDLIIPLGDSDVTARQGVVLDVTADELAKRGIDLSGFLKGPMSLRVADGVGGRVFAIDLRRTEVNLAAVGWTKSKGVPATAQFRLKETSKQYVVEDFELNTDGATIRGDMVLTTSGELQSATFSRFELRAGDSAALSINRSGSKAYRLALTGASFDARGLIRQLKETSESSASNTLFNTLQVNVDLDKVLGFGGVSVSGVSLDATLNNEQLTAASLVGLVDGRSGLDFYVEEQGAGKRMARGTFANTGRLLKFLDLYKRMERGQGSLVINMREQKLWTGNLTVRTLEITEDPAIAQLRQSQRTNSGNSGALVRETQTNGTAGGAAFDVLSLDFNRIDDVLNITKGSLEGAAFGGTVEGLVDLKSGMLGLNGTFVPIYALNNLFAKIPLLGFALGGGNSEGLFGVTYRVSGSLSDPQFTVNPISAIAPGIFRKMFQ
ncbi:MAG: AsmA-like C-terminal domain-containing protein [Rhodobacteraceae bacterium]|nr:AsmA-like C-terminal domain-containing protein [Paracoccaceae bacterium]